MGVTERAPPESPSLLMSRCSAVKPETTPQTGFQLFHLQNEEVDQ